MRRAVFGVNGCPPSLLLSTYAERAVRYATPSKEPSFDAARALVAAERVFADQGIGATVEDVAREAGVGVGTLYRRFAHQQELIDTLVGRLRLELRDLASTAREQPDASGLEGLLVQVGAFQAR